MSRPFVPDAGHEAADERDGARPPVITAQPPGIHGFPGHRCVGRFRHWHACRHPTPQGRMRRALAGSKVVIRPPYASPAHRGSRSSYRESRDREAPEEGFGARARQAG